MKAITTDDGRRMTHAAAVLVAANETLLSEADAQAGDGDHGSNMVSALEGCLVDVDEAATLGAVFTAIADSFQKRVGGASGALLGGFFERLGESLPEGDVATTAEFADALGAATDYLLVVSGATPGHKTMVDAIVPATSAVRDAAQRDADMAAILADAAAAARSGSDATREMPARAGRAKYLPERGVGIVDPGSISVALIFEAWANGLQAPDGEEETT